MAVPGAVDERSIHMDDSTTRPIYGILYVVYHKREPQRYRYGGKTKGTLKRREQGHWSDSNRKRANSRMQNWLIKHKDERDEIVFEQYSVHYSEEELNAAEIALIAKYRAIGQMDLNITAGGDGGLGLPWSEESRAKLSETLRGTGAWKAQFTWDQVYEMRQKYLAGGKLRDLAEEYECKKPTMQKILRNTTWFDPSYDPPSKDEINARKDYVGDHNVSQEVADELRARAQKELKSQQEWAEEFDLGRGTVATVLRNEVRTDPGFDPDSVLRSQPRRPLRKTSWEQVRAVRDYRSRTYEPSERVAEKFGMTKYMVQNILRGRTWKDPEFDPSTIVPRP